MAGARRRRRPIDMRLLVTLLVVLLCTVAFAAVQLAIGLRPYTAANREYDELRRAYQPEPTHDGGESAQTAPVAAESAQDPAEVNQDYVGWLEIAGTNISYPIVQGENNDKYLTTTFEGKENKLGAIFMDYRCTDDFDGRHTVIYGHNAKDGSMFGSLAALLDAEEYPDIQITTADGESRTYRIFSVRETGITDPAYRLEFDGNADFTEYAAMLGAPEEGSVPEGAPRILSLSTCTKGPDKNDRLLVHAALQ